MKESLKDRIVEQFQSRYRKGKQEPVHSQTIGDWGHSIGYKHETVGRRLRELAEEGKLKPVYQKMKNRDETVAYEYIPTDRDKLVYSLNETKDIIKT